MLRGDRHTEIAFVNIRVMFVTLFTFQSEISELKFSAPSKRDTEVMGT